MRLVRRMKRRLLAIAMLLIAATQPLAAGRGSLSVSVNVVRSIAVSVGEGGLASGSVSVRASNGAWRTTRLIDVRGEPGMTVAPRVGDPGHLVVTILADAR